MAYFSVGDTVHIRHDLAEYNDFDGSRIRYYMQDGRHSNVATDDMVMMAGDEVVICSVSSQYMLKDVAYSWTDEMFEEYVRPETEMEIDVDGDDVDVLLE